MSGPSAIGHAERDALAAMVSELTREFGATVPADTIRYVAWTSLEEFKDATVKDFVPLLASRVARSRLRTNTGSGVGPAG